MKKTILTSMLMAAGVASSSAALVTNWVEIFDNQNDNIIGDATTASPSFDSTRQTAMAAEFAAITLADGDSVTLSGSVTFGETLPGDQFRIGLFADADALNVGAGNNYSGYFTAAGTIAGGSLRYTDGSSSPHPFSTGTSSSFADSGNATLTAGGTHAANQPLSFSLTLTRNGSDIELISSYTGGGTSTFSSSNTLSTFSANTQYTFDRVAILHGGNFSNNGTAQYSNIDLTHSPIPEPSSTALLGLSGLALILRRRR